MITYLTILNIFNSAPKKEQEKFLIELGLSKPGKKSKREKVKQLTESELREEKYEKELKKNSINQYDIKNKFNINEK